MLIKNVTRVEKNGIPKNLQDLEKNGEWITWCNKNICLFMWDKFV